MTRVLFDPINLSGLREAGNTLKSGFLTQEGVRSPAFHSLLFTLSITQLLVGGRTLQKSGLKVPPTNVYLDIRSDVDDY